MPRAYWPPVVCTSRAPPEAIEIAVLLLVMTPLGHGLPPAGAVSIFNVAPLPMFSWLNVPNGVWPKFTP
ncbi:hypothetical protein D3C87_1096160 [compost metagenome]